MLERMESQRVAEGFAEDEGPVFLYKHQSQAAEDSGVTCNFLATNDTAVIQG